MSDLPQSQWHIICPVCDRFGNPVAIQINLPHKLASIIHGADATESCMMLYQHFRVPVANALQALTQEYKVTVSAVVFMTTC